MAKKPLKMFKVNNISEVRDVDALYCIKTATDTEFSIVVTDAFGAIVNLKDLQTPAGIQGIASDDGTIEVTGTTFKNIRLSATLVNAINSALKAGDNISDLINDAGYLTSFTEIDPIFQASEASNFVSGDKANLDNQSGVNTGDETTSSIQSKRPLKTVDNKSLEGTGNIEIDYNTVINKPTSFPPSTHTHVISDITGLQGELDNKLDENNPTATGTLTLQTDPSILVGTFDILVRNPSSGVVSKVPEATYRKSSVDVPWMEISGKPSTFPPSAHTHTKSQITDFAHTHPISDVTGLPTALDDLQLNKEDKANKSTSFVVDYLSNIKFPSVKAVYDFCMSNFKKKFLNFGDISGIAHTFGVGSENTMFKFSNNNPITATIPTNATTPLEIGTVFETIAIGNGVLTVTGAPGVTILTNLSNTSVKNEVRRYTKIDTDTWTISGSVKENETLISFTKSNYWELVNPNWYIGGDGTSLLITTDSGTQNLITALSGFCTRNNVAIAPYDMKLISIVCARRAASSAIIGVVKGTPTADHTISSVVSLYEGTSFNSNPSIIIDLDFNTQPIISKGQLVRFSVRHNETAAANSSDTYTFTFKKV